MSIKKNQRFSWPLHGFLLALMFLLQVGWNTASAQLSGTYSIPGNYSTISAAVTDLNNQGVGIGGVTFNVSASHTETLTQPIVLMVTGTSSRPIVFQKSGSGNNPRITAYTGIRTPSSTSAVLDGMWLFEGSDYVTIDGIDFIEAGANTTSLTQMEFAIGLFKVDGTNGSQYNTIRNCTITLNRNNAAQIAATPGTSPIMATRTGIIVANATDAAMTTELTTITASGSNSYNKFYSNTIQNVQHGFGLVGFAAPAPYTLADLGNEIGGDNAGEGNTIINFGGGTGSTGTIAGVFIANQWGFQVNRNTINNNNGSGVAANASMRGIWIFAGTSNGASFDINDNTLTLQTSQTSNSWVINIEGAKTDANGNVINVLRNRLLNCSSTGTTTAAGFWGIFTSTGATTVNIDSNQVIGYTYAGGVTTVPTGGVIYNSTSTSAITNFNVRGNLIRDLSCNGTGTFGAIQSGAQILGTFFVAGNQIRNFTRNSASGIAAMIYHSSGVTANFTSFQNVIDSVRITATTNTTALYGIFDNSALRHVANQNTFSNFQAPATNTVNFIRDGGGAGDVSFIGNTFRGFRTTSGGAGGVAFVGISKATGAVDTIADNEVSDIVSTGGTTGTIIGIQNSGGTTVNIYRNRVFDLTSGSSHSSGNTAGIANSGGTTVNIFNNRIAGINAPAASTNLSIGGFWFSGGTNINLYHNSVFLNNSGTGANYGCNGILVTSTTPNLDIRNNIIVNNSTPSGTGIVAAFRRNAIAFTGFATSSNNNLWYAGAVPSANRVIYHDGTNAYQSLSDFQGFVAPRETASQTELTPFLSTTGSNSNFLKVDLNSASYAESGGSYLTSVSTDFEGDLRKGAPGYSGAGFNADMGADEFEGIPALVCSGTPVPGTISASTTSVCINGANTTSFTITGQTITPGITYQWQQSSTPGGPYTNVTSGSGATTTSYTTGPLSTDTYFVCRVTCSEGGGNDITNEVGITVNNPQLTSTTPATRCGTGTVTLNATAASDVNWYDVPTGGAPLFTGNNFTTPTISTTTTYYAATGASVGYVGLNAANALATTTCGTLAATAGTNWPIRFNTTSSVTIVSVDYIPNAAGTVTIALRQSLSSVDIQSWNFTFNSNQVGIPQTLTLNSVINNPGNYQLVNVVGGGYRISAFSCTYPYNSPGGSFSIVGSATSSTSATNTTTYNIFFNFLVVEGCEGTRVPVTATITSPPAFSVTADQALCANEVATLEVLSNVTNYNSYTWTPTAGLFTDAACTVPYTGTSASTVYFRNTTAGRYAYAATALNTSTQCSALDSVIIFAQPSAALTLGGTPGDICFTGTVTLNVTPSTNLFPGNLKWESVAVGGGAFAIESGATGLSFTTPALTNSTVYRVSTVNSAGNTCVQSANDTVNFYNPQLLTTSPASRCGTGTLTLGATASAGATINWYSAASGGSTVATGAPFVTPSLGITTAYHVSASIGSTVNTIGKTTRGTGSATNLSNYGQQFTFNQPVTLNSFTIDATTGTALTVVLMNAAGTTQLFTTGSVTTTINSTNTINLNWSVPAGTYRLAITTMTGNFFRESSGNTYPQSLNGFGTSNGFFSSLTGTISTTASYYWFYDMRITTGCETPRQQVLATVVQPPALTVTNDRTICNNEIQALTITSDVTDYDTYVWSPVTKLFSDAACTVPYTGASATTVYYRNTTAGSDTIRALGTITATGCTGNASVVLFTQPTSGTISASNSSLCVSGSTTLNLNAASGFGSFTTQWQANSGSGFADVVGLGTSYTTPVITSTTSYRVQVKNTLGNVCFTTGNTDVVVTNPALTATTPASRCGTGTLTLGATANPGETVRWYSAPTGGNPIASGNSFTTPVLSTSTTYYASSSSPGSVSAVIGKTARGTGGGTTLTSYGMQYTFTTGMTLNQVEVDAQSGTSITISLYDATGNTQLFTTGPTAVTSNATNTITLGWTVPAGTYRLAANGMVGNFFRETSGNTYPINLASGYGTIDGFVSSINGTLSTTTAYYWFYNLGITIGCESARTAITATVTTAPTFDVTANTLACNNEVVALNVISNLSDYNNYVWSPNTGLFTDAACTIPYTGTSASTVYFRSTTAGSTRYSCNASNSVSLCTALDSLDIQVLPATLTLNSLPASTCNSASINPTISLSTSSGIGASNISWSSSSDNNTYNPIAGANATSYTASNLSASTYFRATVTSTSGATCQSPQIFIQNFVPSIASTNGDSRCGSGTLTLTAVPGAGETINWYSSLASTTSLGSGNSYTTPAISTTTNYFAESTAGVSNITVGRTSRGTGGATNLASYGHQITFTSNVILNSVQMDATTGTSVTIQLWNQAGTTMLFTTPAITTTINSTNTINLGWSIPAGVYRLHAVNMTGNYWRETSGATYPFNLSNIGTVDGFYTSLASTTLSTGTAYYWFYNINVGVPCTSSRQAVSAVINSAPTFDITANRVACNDEVVTLSVNSNTADFDTYVWTPAANLFTDAAATVPYVAGSSATTVYFKSSTAGQTTVRATANNNTSLCQAIDSAQIVVFPSSLSLNATPGSICFGTPINVTVTLNTTNGVAGNIAWASSSNGVNYNSVAGSNPTYSQNNLTSTTYFQATLTSSQGLVCGTPTVLINNNTPAVASTTPGSRCGTGTVTLSANHSSSGTLAWYDASTSGNLLATGNSFTTPSISSTTNYFVSARTVGATTTVGKTTQGTGSATTLSTYSQNVTFNTGLSLNSVAVVSGTGTAITIALYNSAGTTLLFTTGSRPTTAGVSNTINLGWSVPAGTYRLAVTAMTGTFFRESSGNTYPFALGTVGTMNGFHSSLTGVLTTTTSYYWFYNLNVTAICESARTAVTATVNPIITPSVSIAASATTVCAGQTITYTATPTNAGVSPTYAWYRNGQLVSATGSTYQASTFSSSLDVYAVMTPSTEVCSSSPNFTSNTVTSSIPAAVTDNIVTSAPTTLGGSDGQIALNLTGGSGVGFTFSVFNQITNAPVSVTNSAPTGLFTGLAPGTYRIEATDIGLNASCSNRVTTHIAVVPIPMTTWNGSAWSLGAPNATANARILVANSNPGSFSCLNLEIAPGASLVTTGNTITVSGSQILNYGLGLVGDGALVISGNGTTELFSNTATFGGDVFVNTGATLNVSNIIFSEGANLMHGLNTPSAGGNVAGTLRYRRTGTTNNLQYQLWSSPVAAATISMVDGPDAYSFNASTQSWSTASASTIMTVGVGYAVTGSTSSVGGPAGTSNFVGTANNGDVNVPMVFNGVGSGNWNLVGNPYPSAISGVDFLTFNAAINGAIYLWNTPFTTNPSANNFSGSDYVAKNLLTPAFEIGAAQGFFVESNAATSAQFRNAMRVAGSNAFTRTNQTVKRAYIGVRTNSQDRNVILVGFTNDATDGYDVLYDAKKNKGNANLAFYSILGNRDLDIQGLGELNSNKIVPIGLDANRLGQYTFTIDSLENFDATTQIFLEDVTTGVMHNLRNSGYTIQVTSAGVMRNRFRLHFQPLTTSVVNPTEDFNPVVALHGGRLLVTRLNGHQVNAIDVVDLNGRMVKQLVNLNASGEVMETINLSEGIYMVRLHTSAGVRSYKIPVIH